MVPGRYTRTPSGTFGITLALHCHSEGNHMRQSAAIGIAVYVALMGGVIGGAYAAFDAVIGTPAQTASLGCCEARSGRTQLREMDAGGDQA